MPARVTGAWSPRDREAVDAETRWLAVTPRGDKPPLYEGSVWTDNHEGMTEVALERLDDPEFDGVTFQARLMSIDARFDKASRERALAWTDRARLVVSTAMGQSPALGVDDIVYARGGTLRQRLREHVATNRAGVDEAL